MGKKGGGRVRVKQVGPKGPPINPLQDLMVPAEEMITLPPKMDSSITNFWPVSQTFSMKYKEFPCIWPTYIDSTKTMKEGRRIKKDGAVDSPTVQDISEVLQSMNVRHAIQPFKGYPRDVESRWYNMGRISYDFEQMKERAGGVVEISGNNSSSFMEPIDVDNIPEMQDEGEIEEKLTQKQCWKLIASKIDGMPGRIARKLAEKKAAEEEAKKEKARKIAAAKNSKANKNAGAGSNKKKGKKKR